MKTVKVCVVILYAAVTFQLYSAGLAQPSIACPDLFRYVIDGNDTYGIITLPINLITNKSVHLTVTINQHNLTNFGYSLLPVESIDNTVLKIYEGKPIEFRLRFSTELEYPKLIKITVNGNTICADIDDSSPNMSITLQHAIILPLGSSTYPSTDRSLEKLHNCFNYFRYEEVDDNTTVGRIKIPNYLFNGATREVSVKVAQNTHIKDKTFGLNPFKNLDEVKLDILEGKPISYRFDFPDQNDIPILKNIKVNGKIICATNNGRSGIFRYSGTHSIGLMRGFENLNTDDDDDDDDDDGNEESKDKRTCGLEIDALTPILKFQDTSGQFPWLTAIFQKNEDSLKFLCSGTLISARTVISAANCFQPEHNSTEQIIVKIGGGIKAAGSQILDFGVEKIVIHPEYKINLISDANIALLHLTSSVTFSNYINQICLWNEAVELYNIANKIAYIAGWSSIENDSIANTTQKIGFTRIVNNIECLSSSDKFKSITTPRTFCASNFVIPGPCTGDSGSPVMMRKSKHWSLRGIKTVVQRLDGECNLNEFVVFCDLAKHLDWLKANIVP